MLESIKNKIEENALIVILILGLVLMFFFSKIRGSQEKVETEKIVEPPKTADTYIPKGKVLVPVEIINKHQLSELVGSHAIVDLYVRLDEFKDENKLKENAEYTGGISNNSFSLLAKSIKLLRAPLNSDLFAVLADESESTKFMNSKGFWVVLHNSESNSPFLASLPAAASQAGVAQREIPSSFDKTNDRANQNRSAVKEKYRVSLRKFDVRYGLQAL